VEIPQFCRDAVDFQSRHGKSRLNIESVGGFKAVPQTLRDTNRDILLKEIIPHGDKFQRAQGVAAAWNEGRILVPMNATWLAAFLKELADFTGVNDATDDEVDALSHAWNETNAVRTVFRGNPVPGGGRRI
jgi:predicted phage terminase large subunit-like protein